MRKNSMKEKINRICMIVLAVIVTVVLFGREADAQCPDALGFDACAFGNVPVTPFAGMPDLSQIAAAENAMTQMSHQYGLAAANAFLNDRRAVREATGYTGYIPGPVSAMDLSRTISGIGQAWDSYNQSWHNNSKGTMNVLDQYGQAVRSTGYYTDPSGQALELPSNYQYYWQDPYGTFTGTDTYTPPDPYTTYTPYIPAW